MSALDTKVSYTRVLSDFASGQRYDDLPAEVVEAAKRILLDTIGCAAGSYRFARQQMLLDVARELGGRPQATIWGQGDKVSAPVAAFVNAEAANALDADETLRLGTHVGGVIAASSFAAAERTGASGKDLLNAIATGYEVAIRVGYSMVMAKIAGEDVEASPVHGLGYAAIGGAVASGLLHGLKGERLADTIGIAAALCPSPVGGKMGSELRLSSLKVNPKMGLAHSAVLAAIMAQRGFNGDRTILEGEKGFWRFQGGLGLDGDLITRGLGQQWWILESSVKPYPACRYIHHSLDLLYKTMREHKIGFDDIEAVTVAISPKRKRLLYPSYDLEKDQSDPATLVNLQFNTPYLLAVAALGVKPGPAWYAPELLLDPRIRAFMARVRIQAHPGSVLEEIRATKEEPGGKSKTSITSLSLTAKGRTFAEETEYAVGEPYFPHTRFTDAQLVDKFNIFCDGVLPSGKVEQAAAAVFGLERLINVSGLAALLAP
ncbi:MAG: MmgE/PrpD family protein [Chloroflexi bacterium]|nr:MmgE/PrpD family protein [Chloroflexota bacterium]